MRHLLKRLSALLLLSPVFARFERKYEHPGKTFFDHVYSSLGQERIRMADPIAAGLAEKVCSCLSGS